MTKKDTFFRGYFTKKQLSQNQFLSEYFSPFSNNRLPNERQTLPPILKMSVLWNLYYLFAKRLIQITISLAKNRSITLGRRLYNVSDISLPVLTNCRIGKKV